MLLEDLIENCAQFVKHHLSKHIYPFCDDGDSVKTDGAKTPTAYEERVCGRRASAALICSCCFLLKCLSILQDASDDQRRFNAWGNARSFTISSHRSFKCALLSLLRNPSMIKSSSTSVAFQHFDRHTQPCTQQVHRHIRTYAHTQM